LLIGSYSFTLGVRLTNYPEKGYFPKTTPFTVTVLPPKVLLTPSVATSFEYTIGSVMISQTYKINLIYGTSSISVNGQFNDILNTYGIKLEASTNG
jgi:hypothetical protein